MKGEKRSGAKFRYTLKDRKRIVNTYLRWKAMMPSLLLSNYVLNIDGSPSPGLVATWIKLYRGKK